MLGWLDCTGHNSILKTSPLTSGIQDERCHPVHPPKTQLKCCSLLHHSHVSANWAGWMGERLVLFKTSLVTLFTRLQVAENKGWLCFCVLIYIIIDVNEVNMIDMDFNKYTKLVLPIDHAVILPSSPGLRWIGGLSNLSIVVQPLLRHLSHQQGGPADRLLSNQQTYR